MKNLVLKNGKEIEVNVEFANSVNELMLRPVELRPSICLKDENGDVVISVIIKEVALIY